MAESKLAEREKQLTSARKDAKVAPPPHDIDGVGFTYFPAVLTVTPLLVMFRAGCERPTRRGEEGEHVSSCDHARGGDSA